MKEGLASDKADGLVSLMKALYTDAFVSKQHIRRAVIRITKGVDLSSGESAKRLADFICAMINESLFMP